MAELEDMCPSWEPQRSNQTIIPTIKQLSPILSSKSDQCSQLYQKPISRLYL
ncbi:hypothetical protein O3M35_002389 [Rhynocoris fuscipes]|uniref:Uncharacterized protein n=1 Tax=Rhynocoris fuscipes TaxID=488301 RepID=A0AAW1CLC5_9HEMI